MSNVIDIFSRNQSADTSESDSDDNLTPDEVFAETIAANKENKKKMEERRKKYNKSTFRRYKIKPKGD